MKRRSLLKLATAVAAWSPVARLRAFAQSPVFTDAQRAVLDAIADTALPASLGREGRSDAVRKFVSWHTNYKAGADMGHGYGASTLRAASGPPVVGRYAAQFAALDQAAKAQGAASFAAAPVNVRKSVIESALSTPQPVNRLPARPTGANLVADFMGLYFSSAEAFDLAYRAQIGRDVCRGLEGSDQPPAKMEVR